MIAWFLGACTDIPTPEPAVEAPAAPVARAERSVPVLGGGLLVASDGTTAVAADAPGARLVRIDTTSAAITGEILLSEGDLPNRMVEDGEGYLHVVLRGAGEVATVDLGTFEVIGRTPVCTEPRGIAWDRFSDTLLVACASGELVELDDEDFSSTAVWVGSDLRDVAVDPDGVRFVSRFREAQILEIAPWGQIVLSTTLPDTYGVIGRKARVAWEMLPDPGGGVVVLHQRHQSAELTTTTPAYYSNDDDDACGPVVIGAISRVRPGGLVETGTELGLAASPVDLAVHEGSFWVAAAGANAGVDRWADLVDYGPLTAAPLDPTSPCALPVHRVDVAGASMTVAVAFDGAGRVVTLGQEPFAVTVDGVTVASGGPVVQSARLFHEDAGLGVACASCHPEGGDDAHVWTFPEEGARRTQSLAVGGMSGLAPYHWDGEFLSFTHLSAEIFGARMGRETVPSAPEAEALLSWLDGLAPVRVTPSGDAESIARGRDIFAAAACGTCHAGPSFASSVPADVGTGGLFQVPTLVGVGGRAPYLHDGCAATLADRFGWCGGSEHGDEVAASDLPDLIAYLETL